MLTHPDLRVDLSVAALLLFSWLAVRAATLPIVFAGLFTIADRTGAMA